MKVRSSLQRLLVVVTFVLLSLTLVACGELDLTADLPERPTPFPTLPRLPSVTPVTPSPTSLPTATIVPSVTPTPTPTLQALAATTANMRSSPDLNASIVAIVEAGQIVTLRTRQGDWFAVELADGQRGWMFITVLTIDPAIAEAVPEAGTP